MRPVLTKELCLIGITLLLSSCATTSLVDSWRSPSLSGQRLHKVLVVGIFKNSSKRRVYEDILVSELKKSGVDAVPGYTVIPEKASGARKELESAMKKAGVEGVLTVQTVSVERQVIVRPGNVDTYPGYWYPPAFPSWDVYDYYGATGYYEPSYISTYDIARIQVNIFAAQSGKLLWAATIKTSEPGNVVSVSKDLAEIVIRSLKQEGLI